MRGFWEDDSSADGGVAGRPSRGKKGFVTPTETSLHGAALCFVVKTQDHRSVIEQGLAVGGGW